MTASPGASPGRTDPRTLDLTTRLVQFLRELATAGNPPVRDVAAYEAVLWLAEAPRMAKMGQNPGAGDVVLSLDLVPREGPPPAPALVQRWLPDPARVEYWDGLPVLPDPLREADEANGVTALALEDVSGLAEGYDGWALDWDRWAHRDREVLALRAWYDVLRDVARTSAQGDDRTELVLGGGLLTWQHPEAGKVRNHLVHTRVAAVEDEDSGRIDVVITGEATTRFQDRQVLVGVSGYEPQRAEPLRRQLRSSSPAPFSDELVDVLDQWRAVSLEVSRPVLPSWDSSSVPAETAEVRLAPALVVRPRDRSSLIDYYDQMLAVLSGPDATAPLGLAQLVAPIEADERTEWLAQEGASAGSVLSDDPLFPLPANPEQQQIMGRLRNDSGVVVQGPPGTGKTHTIANLVTALLARGQRVLVTSQKPQALRVLRDKLPPEVQDLCVSMTDLARGGSQELQRSVNTLADRHAQHDAARQAQEISALSSERTAARSRVTKLKEQVRALRESETYVHPAVAQGYSGTLAEIVSLLSGKSGACGWMPVPLPPGAPASAPLTTEEVEEVRLLVSASNPRREARAAQELPDVSALATGASVRSMVVAEAAAHTDADAVTSALSQSLARVSSGSMAALRHAVRTGAEAIRCAGLPEAPSNWAETDWRARALRDLFAGRERSVWEGLRSVGDRARTALSDLQVIGARVVSLPDFPPSGPESAAAQLAAGRELRAWLDGGERLRRWPKPPVQRRAGLLLAGAAVDGVPVANVELLDVVLAHLGAVLSAAATNAQWDVVEHQVDPSLPLVRRLARLVDDHDALEQVFSARSARDEAVALCRLEEVDVRLEAPEDFLGLGGVLAAVTAQREAEAASSRLDELAEQLGLLAAGERPAPELRQLSTAVAARDADAYSDLLSVLAGAGKEKADQLRCEELLSRLACHPELQLLMQTTAEDAAAWAHRRTSWEAAWQWARARTFFDDQRTPGREQALDADLSDAVARVQSLTAKLAASEAWSECLARMTSTQVQALRAYQQIMSDRGMGKGKFVDRMDRAARQALAVSQGAVPAWVMPLPEVLDTMPAERGSFDVVIVDEASQASIESIFLLWLAPRVIVVGDDRQCAPAITRLGQLQPIYDKLDDYLPDLPEYLRDAFTPRSSLFSLLQPRFGTVVRLKEHFRCMPEIIGYSSSTFYQDMPLVPLRQFGADRLDPVNLVHVEGGVADGSATSLRNAVEAERLVDQLMACTADPAYRDKTFGVVVLQGTGQVELIREMLDKRLPRQEWARRKVRVGTPPDFQGDERHVVFLSMVIAERRSAATSRDWQRRFNVAASRAQDQMWLFTSVSPDLLSPLDLRRGLLEYSRNPPAALASDDYSTVTANEPHPPFDSLFEQRVFLRIRERGFHVIPQYEVNGRFIDLVVTGAGGRLAVECDGVAFHSSPSQVAADIDRELQLKRAGWRFWRVRDSEFNHDPAGSLESLWKVLEQRGIAPGGAPTDRGPSSPAARWTPTSLSDVEGFDGLEGADPQDLDAVSATQVPSQRRAHERTPAPMASPRDSGDERRRLHSAARAWARQQGHVVGDRGSVRDEIVAAYQRSLEGDGATHRGEAVTRPPRASADERDVRRRDPSSAGERPGGGRGRALPVGFVHVAWVDGDEAAAVLRAAAERRHVVVQHADGSERGRVVYDASDSPAARRAGTRTRLQRYRKNDRPEEVGWIREDEAHAVVEALVVEGDVATDDGQAQVVFFPRGSSQHLLHGCQTRLISRRER